jgi:hypothetical protein
LESGTKWSWQSQLTEVLPDMEAGVVIECDPTDNKQENNV